MPLSDVDIRNEPMKMFTNINGRVDILDTDINGRVDKDDDINERGNKSKT